MSNTMNWPYSMDYGAEKRIDTDVLVIGGGMTGPMAAITAAKRGLKVALLDKGGVRRSGSAGTGFDHYMVGPNPASTITAEEMIDIRLKSQGGYAGAIGKYITLRESYDILLEMESYGAKVRDTDDMFKGAAFRDERTKFLFATDYTNRYTMRVWGRTFKPALYKELKRLGVQLYERVMATSLLTEGGKQGGRVVGATGFNVRTGEFYVFHSKATIMGIGHPSARGWIFSMDLQGMGGRHGPGSNSGDGHAIAWRAGAELTMMEKSELVRRHRSETEGSWFASWSPCTLVDSDGKQIPWVDRDGKIVSNVSDREKPSPGQSLVIATGPHAMKSDSTLQDFYYKYTKIKMLPDLDKRIANGEYKLPLYCDFPSMPELERRVIYGLMIGQEATTWLGYHTMTRAGFDPDKHLLQVYDEPVAAGGFGWRRLTGGGLVIDWDLKTSLDGLYAAGDLIFDGVGVSAALVQGRYAAHKASDYALKSTSSGINENQVNSEKARVYAPLQRENGIEWKELESGLAKVMQHYCGDTKSDERLKLGLKWIDELKLGEIQNTYARNPHELMRVLEVFNLVDWCQAVMHQCLARKASSLWLNFKRLDYPRVDPPEWNKLITVKQKNGTVKVGQTPMDYFGDLPENYDKYSGFKNRKRKNI